MRAEQKAMDLVTTELLDSLTYGEMIDLTEGYYLYHYEDDNFITLNNKDDEEIYCVMYGANNNIIFEKL